MKRFNEPWRLLQLLLKPRDGVAVHWRTFKKHIPGATKEQFCDYLAEKVATKMLVEMTNTAIEGIRNDHAHL